MSGATHNVTAGGRVLGVVEVTLGREDDKTDRGEGATELLGTGSQWDGDSGPELEVEGGYPQHDTKACPVDGSTEAE